MSAEVLQLGTGAFLRGFLDWMLHEIGFEGALCVSGLTRGGGVAALRAADLCFGHALRGLAGGTTVDRSIVNRVLTDACDPYAEWDRLQSVAANPALRLIVSNATEAGLVWRSARAPAPCPDPFPAKLTALLAARFRALGDAPEADLLVTPTELVEDNGPRLAALVRRQAEDWELGSAFRGWLEQHVHWVSTLVDRIVSKSPTDADALAITSEPYHLWALEDGEALERILPLRAHGLNVVSSEDLAPWRERKLRLLNGGHACLVFTGLLAGLEHVGDAMAHPAQRAFLERCLRDEVLPTLTGDRAELEAYLADVLERFANPFVAHRLDAIRLNSHAKVHVRLLPAMRDHAARTGALPPGLTLALAAFLRLYRDVTGGDEPATLARHHAGWRRGGVEHVLADPVLFPPHSLAGLPDLVDAVQRALAALERGVEGALG